VLTDIAKAISVAVAVLGALGAQTGVDLAKVSPIIGKIAGILASLSGITNPNSLDKAIHDLELVLDAAQKSGLLTNVPAVNEALDVISKYKVVEADYVAGQVALISSTFSFNGIGGDLIAVRKSGAAAKLLGL